MKNITTFLLLQAKVKRSLASCLSRYNPKRSAKKVEKYATIETIESSTVSNKGVQNDVVLQVKDQVNLQLSMNNSTQVEEE